MKFYSATPKWTYWPTFECVRRIAHKKGDLSHIAQELNTLMACAVRCARAEPDIATFQHKLAQSK